MVLNVSAVVVIGARTKTFGTDLLQSGWSPDMAVSMHVYTCGKRNTMTLILVGEAKGYLE